MMGHQCAKSCRALYHICTLKVHPRWHFTIFFSNGKEPWRVLNHTLSNGKGIPEGTSASFVQWKQGRRIHIGKLGNCLERHFGKGGEMWTNNCVGQYA